MVITMLIKVRRTMHEQSESFNKEIENIRKYQTEVTELNTITELKNSIAGFYIRLDEAKKGLANSKTGGWNSPNQRNKRKKERKRMI